MVFAVKIAAGWREAEGVPQVEFAKEARCQDDGVVACFVRRNVVHGSWATHQVVTHYTQYTLPRSHTDVDARLVHRYQADIGIGLWV